MRAASCLASFSCSLYAASALRASACASSSSVNWRRIASWRAVMALLIGGIRYLPKIHTRIANASRLTRKVPLGTRKLLVAIGCTAVMLWMLICQSCLLAGGSNALGSLTEDEDEERHEGQVDEVHTFDQRDRQEEDRLQAALGFGLTSHALDVRRAGQAVTHAGADSTTGEGQAAADEGARGLDGRVEGGVCCHCFSLVPRRFSGATGVPLGWVERVLSPRALVRVPGRAPPWCRPWPPPR